MNMNFLNVGSRGDSSPKVLSSYLEYRSDSEATGYLGRMRSFASDWHNTLKLPKEMPSDLELLPLEKRGNLLFLLFLQLWKRPKLSRSWSRMTANVLFRFKPRRISTASFYAAAERVEEAF